MGGRGSSLIKCQTKKSRKKSKLFLLDKKALMNEKLAAIFCSNENKHPNTKFFLLQYYQSFLGFALLPLHY